MVRGACRAAVGVVVAGGGADGCVGVEFTPGGDGASYQDGAGGRIHPLALRHDPLRWQRSSCRCSCDRHEKRYRSSSARSAQGRERAVRPSQGLASGPEHRENDGARGRPTSLCRHPELFGLPRSARACLRSGVGGSVRGASGRKHTGRCHPGHDRVCRGAPRIAVSGGHGTREMRGGSGGHVGSRRVGTHSEHHQTHCASGCRSQEDAGRPDPQRRSAERAQRGGAAPAIRTLPQEPCRRGNIANRGGRLRSRFGAGDLRQRGRPTSKRQIEPPGSSSTV